MMASGTVDNLPAQLNKQYIQLTWNYAINFLLVMIYTGWL